MASKVYFTDFRTNHEQSLTEKLQKLIRKAGMDTIDFEGKFVAIKMHFGEPGNLAFLRPNYARAVVDVVKELGGKPFLTDCNTLYPGSRKNALEHLYCAWENGFTPLTVGCPILIGDGLKGTDDIEVPVQGGEYVKNAKIGRAVMDADVFISLSHFKGHAMGGFGGAIKNLAMGCAPQAGKIDQHGRNVVIYPKCIGCGQCVPLCPRNALSLEKAEKGRHAVIDKERCIGCYECVTACKQGAIGVDTPNEYSDFAERMAEYAYGAVKGKEGRICYLNFLLNVTPQCDCAGWSEPAIVPDLGILASEDPVALDTACFELVKEAHSLIPLGEHGAHSCGYDKFSALHPNTRGWHQVEYAESIGMGSRDYELITV